MPNTLDVMHGNQSTEDFTRASYAYCQEHEAVIRERIKRQQANGANKNPWRVRVFTETNLSDKLSGTRSLYELAIKRICGDGVPEEDDGSDG